MARFQSLWQSLEMRQRIIAVLALVATLAAVVGLVQAVRTPSMVTLYSGLQPAVAGEVASAVEAMGVTVQAQGSSVLVPVADRDRVRLALAAAGLPRNGPAGYEILDGLDGFGTTSEMFEATYWRAKEGELARTILAAPDVRSARVHIANPVGRPFQRGASPSASVTVTMGVGTLDTAQAEAIRFLVASAVSGLSPEQVSVIDAQNGVVLRMGEAAGGMQSRLPGSAREAKMRSEIERLLAARVGDGRSIVTVSVDTNMESETLTERVIDPQSRVAISSDTRDVTENATGGLGGAATVASNLPQVAAGPNSESKSSRTENEEKVNYEVSETRRERVRQGGEVKRVTVAVLVDGVVQVAADGTRSWTPRPAEELGQLRDLVRSAVGFDETRGDVVTVETLEFAERPQEGVLVEAGFSNFLARNGMMLIQVGVLGMVALGLIMFVLRPLLMKAGDLQTLPELPPLPALEAPDFGFPQRDAMESEPPDRLSILRDAFDGQKEQSAHVLRAWLERDVRASTDAENEVAQ